MDWTLGHTPHHPHHGKAGGNNTLDSSHQNKESTGGRPESHLSKTMTYVLFFTFCLTPCHGQLIPFKQDENIWVYLAN